MWTNNNRGRYDRSKLRYPSDMTDDEWGLIRPLIPPAKRGGNKRTVDEREVVNGLMYILSTGCQWASLPKDLPPRSTVNDYFCRWNHDGTLDRVHHALYVYIDRVQPDVVPKPIQGHRLASMALPPDSFVFLHEQENAAHYLLQHRA